jgi:hypothetical protein
MGINQDSVDTGPAEHGGGGRAASPAPTMAMSVWRMRLLSVGRFIIAAKGLNEF